jgi:hypothetical protein
MLAYLLQVGKYVIYIIIYIYNIRIYIKSLCVYIYIYIHVDLRHFLFRNVDNSGHV